MPTLKSNIPAPKASQILKQPELHKSAFDRVTYWGARALNFLSGGKLAQETLCSRIKNYLDDVKETLGPKAYQDVVNGLSDKERKALAEAYPEFKPVDLLERAIEKFEDAVQLKSYKKVNIQQRSVEALSNPTKARAKNIKSIINNPQILANRTLNQI